MGNWDMVDGETEDSRRERLAKAASHAESPFDLLDDNDRRLPIRDALRACRPQDTWRDRGALFVVSMRGPSRQASCVTPIVSTPYVVASSAPPIMVDVDPVDGVCNLDCCPGAVRQRVRASRPTTFMSIETMRGLECVLRAAAGRQGLARLR